MNRFRDALSDYRALLPYAILGVIAGACSAAVIILFDLLINLLSSLWLKDGAPDGFEALSVAARFCLPVAGALILGLVFSALKSEDREVGIVHVLSRMHSHYGQLPLRNAVVQFIGGAFALATGQSGGREGPGVHLGAAINSSIGGWLQLPNNSQRILIGCGTAASIAVAFNTPLAGVIFAMEVIILEYTVVGFTPVILSAVTATVIGRLVGLDQTILVTQQMQLNSLAELPFIILLGFLAGCAVSLFVVILKYAMRLGHLSVLTRFTLAGLLTGTLAVAVPQILGMGYDTLNQVLLHQLAPALLLAVIIGKLVTTSFSVGMGLPVGLIGPNLVIGACLGGLLGSIGMSLYPDLASDPALYVVIGMGATMAAVLNAPLAALLAVMELTRNVGAVLPSMLAIAAATLTTAVVFRQRSAHQTALAHLQRTIPEDAAGQMMHQTNVRSVMNRLVVAQDCHPADNLAAHASLGRSEWCLLHREGQPLYLVQSQMLLEQLANPTQTPGPEPAAATEIDTRETDTPEQFQDLTELDIRRWSVGFIGRRSTLQEALDILRKDTVEAVLVNRRGIASVDDIEGVITRDSIEQYYLRRL